MDEWCCRDDGDVHRDSRGTDTAATADPASDDTAADNADTCKRDGINANSGHDNVV